MCGTEMGSRLVPALLRDRVFRRYWSASTISMFGDQISGIALRLAAVIVLHVGAAQMGYLTALEWLPSLLFGLPAGAWVDRRGRRRATMVMADLGRAGLFASIPVCYALHVLTLPQLYAVTFGAGTLSILFNVSAPLSSSPGSGRPSRRRITARGRLWRPRGSSPVLASSAHR
jgi:MFS family permease